MLQIIWEQLDNYYNEMVKIRRYLHQYPELSFKEVKTAQYIISFYEKLGIQVTGNVGGNGVVAKISGENLEKQLRSVLILTLFQSKMKKMLLISQRFQVSCTPVVMMGILQPY